MRQQNRVKKLINWDSKKEILSKRETVYAFQIYIYSVCKI